MIQIGDMSLEAALASHVEALREKGFPDDPAMGCVFPLPIFHGMEMVLVQSPEALARFMAAYSAGINFKPVAEIDVDVETLRLEDEGRAVMRLASTIHYEDGDRRVNISIRHLRAEDGVFRTELVNITRLAAGGPFERLAAAAASPYGVN